MRSIATSLHTKLEKAQKTTEATLPAALPMTKAMWPLISYRIAQFDGKLLV